MNDHYNHSHSNAVKEIFVFLLCITDHKTTASCIQLNNRHTHSLLQRMLLKTISTITHD